jgi:hypothetical protein
MYRISILGSIRVLYRLPATKDIKAESRRLTRLEALVVKQKKQLGLETALGRMTS